MSELDFYFPFIVLAYGAVMAFVTSIPTLKERANQNFSPELVQWFYGHRMLGLTCLMVGGLWSLQRLLLA